MIASKSSFLTFPAIFSALKGLGHCCNSWCMREHALDRLFALTLRLYYVSNVETIEYNISFTIWDLGGLDKVMLIIMKLHSNIEAGVILHVAQAFINKNYHTTVVCQDYNKA
ncbi:uncharacterized protein LOC126410582 [Nymphaea colorata]|nr:uncharacterized protein LOC126410582 [Nymphaea colorata]